MAEIMMQLGSFQFGLATAAYQELTRSTNYTWAAQPRFGQDDALQNTGPGADNITLPGIVYPEFRGGTGQLDALRALAAQRTPLRLMDGLGRMRGEWVIEKVDERATVFAQRGVARRQEFTVSLRRAPTAAPVSLGAVAAITAGTLPVPTLLNSALSVAATASKGPTGILSSLSSSVSAINGFAGQIGGQVSGILKAVNSGVNAAKRLQNAGRDAAKLLGGVKSLANIPSAMNSLVQLGGSVSNASGVASSLLNKAGIDLQTGGVNPAAIKAVQDAMISINKLNVMSIGVRTEAQRIAELKYLRDNTTIK